MQEIKRPRGRPATGRKRNKTIGCNVTADEHKQIKDYLKTNEITLADLLVRVTK